MKTKFLTLILLILISQTSYAKLKMYYCDNKEDQKTCSNTCSYKSNEYSYEYKVNASSNVVIENTYKNNILTSSEPLENCSVVDSKNWVCNLMGWGKSGNKDYKMGSRIMTNGVYFFISTDSPPPGVIPPIYCRK